MTRIFFSHASEDKPLVEAVYDEFTATFPHYEPWLDKYEIVGGDSLIEKIAAGMDAADKFFIFLSPVSVEKPWVKKELHRALVREINGTEPYIIPVKIGDLENLPSFLEEKLYIDLARLKKPEWLAQFDAAIKGEAQKPSERRGNVEIYGQYAETPNIARITFTARAWAEEFSYGVAAKEDIQKAYIDSHNMFTMQKKVDEPRAFAVQFATPELRPGQPITLRVEFAEGIDAMEAIHAVGPYDPERQTITPLRAT
jgi:hypothetical protein